MNFVGGEPPRQEPAPHRDPLGHGQPGYEAQMPLTPPWAAAYGLHPPYPGGSFDEYLDPQSRYYRADIVAALLDSPPAGPTPKEIRDLQRGRLWQSLVDAVEQAQTLTERIDALIVAKHDAPWSLDDELVLGVWAEVMAAGLYAPTHQTVTLKLQQPLLSGRLSEGRDREDVWGYTVEDSAVMVTREGRAFFQHDPAANLQRPARGGLFAVRHGEKVRAGIIKKRMTKPGGTTMKRFSWPENAWHLAAARDGVKADVSIPGVLEHLRDGRTGG